MSEIRSLDAQRRPIILRDRANSMAKQPKVDRASRRKEKRAGNAPDLSPQDEALQRSGIRRLDFKCRGSAQQHYLTAIQSKRIIIGVGPAGVGKTFVCTCEASKQYRANAINRIIVMRPAVTAEEDLGHLPGDLNEKLEPFFIPFREVLEEWFGKSGLENMIKNRNVEVASLGHARGRTFANAFVILDEAQNTTPKQMKLFLTRLGQGSTMVINGDITQKDIPGPSGLEDILTRMRDLPDSQICTFTNKDSVRDPLVAEILARYEDK